MNTGKNRRAVCSAVAHILRQERQKRGLTLAAVAARAGLSYQMVGFVEKEIRNPTLDTLLRIAAALEIDLAEIICQAQSISKIKAK
ncbi:MAG: helix-turn-helix transcriptional regulator [Verrucomicrobiota bacterium]|jgi:transcriptional regulator with XRE-family HTH domain